jgi:hypothetical protein
MNSLILKGGAYFVVVSVVLAASAGLSAETLSFSGFRIELADGWEHQHRKEDGAGDDRGDLISIGQAGGAGILKMKSVHAPAVVTKDMLRNLTNLDASITLRWQHWGEYSGYQYSYTERASFYRQWWLSNEQTILLVTYQCDPEFRDSETEAVDKMLGSLEVSDIGTGVTDS